MLVLGIIFLMLYCFFMISQIVAIMDIHKRLELMVKRQDEIIRILKKK